MGSNNSYVISKDLCVKIWSLSRTPQTPSKQAKNGFKIATAAIASPLGTVALIKVAGFTSAGIVKGRNKVTLE